MDAKCASVGGCSAVLMLGDNFYDHHMEFIDKGRDADCPNTYFAISGAGSKTRDSGGIVVPNDGPGNAGLFYDEINTGFAYIEVSGPRMHFEFIAKNGDDVVRDRDPEVIGGASTQKS